MIAVKNEIPIAHRNTLENFPQLSGDTPYTKKELNRLIEAANFFHSHKFLCDFDEF